MLDRKTVAMLVFEKNCWKEKLLDAKLDDLCLVSQWGQGKGSWLIVLELLF